MSQDLLDAMVGEWEGVYKLWLEPGALRSESSARASIRPVLEARYVHDYEWSDQDAPQQGTMLLGRDGGAARQMAWVDTWHTGASIMVCMGEAGLDATVVGRYGGGWRTAWGMPDADQLVVTAWNISPQCREDKATGTTYERRTSTG